MIRREEVRYAVGRDSTVDRLMEVARERGRAEGWAMARTYGERAVGLDFNPSGDESVKQIKEAFAEIIDVCAGARERTDDPETKRLWSVAITEAQTAQMWAVKAATWRV